jgi:hypothetical protein
VNSFLSDIDTISKIKAHLEKTNEIIENSIEQDSLFHDSSKNKIFKLWLESNNFALNILEQNSKE